MYWIDNSSRLNGSSKQVPFYSDSSSDVANLPTSQQAGVQQGDDTVSCLPCAKGSTCFCIADSSLYVLNSNDQWVEV